MAYVSMEAVPSILLLLFYSLLLDADADLVILYAIEAVYNKYCFHVFFFTQ